MMVDFSKWEEAWKSYSPSNNATPGSPAYICNEIGMTLAIVAAVLILAVTFYGDENYLVTTRELAEQLQDMRRLPRNIDQVLVPTTKGDMLRKLYDLSGNGSPSYRHRPASEMLYAMVEANGRRASRYRK